MLNFHSVITLLVRFLTIDPSLVRVAGSLVENLILKCQLLKNNQSHNFSHSTRFQKGKKERSQLSLSIMHPQMLWIRNNAIPASKIEISQITQSGIIFPGGKISLCLRLVACWLSRTTPLFMSRQGRWSTYLTRRRDTPGRGRGPAYPSQVNDFL